MTLSPVLLVTLLGVGSLAAVRLRGHAGAGRWRLAALILAMTLLAAAFISPVEALAESYLLTAHLVQATVVMGFVPPLLLLGLPPGWPRSGPLRRLWSVASHPAIAIVLVNGVFFGWHAGPVYDACLRHHELYAVQLVSLLAVSLAFWSAIVAADAGERYGLTPFLKLGYILLATIPQTFAGLVFALAGHPFYSVYATAPPQLGLSALNDQQLAGACMALLSKLALFAAFSVVLWRMLEPAAYETDDDGGGGGGRGRPPGDEPAPVRPDAPAWLALLDAEPLGEEPAPQRAPTGAPR